MKTRKKKSTSRSVRSVTAKQSLTHSSRKQSATTPEASLIPHPQTNTRASASAIHSVPTLQNEYPVLRATLQKSFPANTVSSASLPQDNPMQRLVSFESSFLEARESRHTHRNASFPKNNSLRSFSEKQQTEVSHGDRNLLLDNPSSIGLCEQVSVITSLPSYSTTHTLPLRLQPEAVNDLSKRQTSSSATRVKFFHGRARSPVFSRMLELGSFSSDGVDTGLPINETFSSQLTIQKTGATPLQNSKIGETWQQPRFRKTGDSAPLSVVRTNVWVPPPLEGSFTTGYSKKIEGHPYCLSKPNPSFSIKCSDTRVANRQTERACHVVPSFTSDPFLLSQGNTDFLEKGLSVAPQKEGNHQETKKRTHSLVNQTLPFKKRKWLWRSSLKKDFRAAAVNERVFVENKTAMISPCLPEQIFFKTNAPELEAIRSDEEGVNINPLQIDLDRPDTP